MATDIATDESTGELSRITTFRRDGLAFPVRDTGPLDGEPVLLLHGWPQDSRSWTPVAALLNAAGYRTFAPDQRGASPTAAPRRRRAYRMDELAADVEAMIDQIGRPTHVVGHDWGAVAAWAAGITMRDRLLSVSALSVPHPGAFMRAMVTSRQALASWYMYVFQLPLLPELLLRSGLFPQLLRRTGQSAEVAARDSARMRDRAIARGGLNWYRGMLFGSPRMLRGHVTAPVLQIWSDEDSAVLETGPKLCERYVDGPFRFEVLSGVSHWIPEEAPEPTSRLLLEHFATSSAR